MISIYWSRPIRKKRDMAATVHTRAADGRYIYNISNQSVMTYLIGSIKTKRKDGSEIWMIVVCDYLYKYDILQ